MLLAVDVGNTNTVVGIFEEAVLRASWRIATDQHRMPDEYAALLTTLFGLADIDRGSIDGAVVCSVVPAAEDAVCATVRRYWDLRPVVVSSSMDTGIPLCYSPPQAVGPDRIANAVSTIHVYGAPAVVVDFGTATTFDAIASPGTYAGGAIAPGLEVAAESLFSHTARLRPVPLEAPATAIGADTTASLQSGILFGYAGLVDGLVRRFLATLGSQAPVVATGGLAPIVSPHTETIRHVDPDLTLVGLRLLYERNVGHTDRSSAGQDQPFA